MNKKLVAVATALSIGVTGIAFTVGAAGHSNSGDVVSARKMVMKNTGASMKAAGKMLGSGSFDANLAAALGRTLQSGAAALPHLFPEGSFDGDTTAAPSIVGSDKFKELSATLESAGLAMAVATDAASLGAAMKQAGSTCKACHSEFRVLK
ncbi:MAG: c-type cytochrome [Alphaproteobacteria bacterium]